MSKKILTVGQLLYQWLSQFATTYRGVLPAGVKPESKYLQYSGYVDYFANPFILPVQIYTLNTTSYAGVLEIADAISTAVTEGGMLISDDAGTVKIKIQKGSPFYQDKEDEDETVRAGYINLEVTVYGGN